MRRSRHWAGWRTISCAAFVAGGTVVALGLFSPMLTTILHNGSTIGILLNAFRRNAAFRASKRGD